MSHWILAVTMEASRGWEVSGATTQVASAFKLMLYMFCSYYLCGNVILFSLSCDVIHQLVSLAHMAAARKR
jgi:hypothetical protein